ncbi:sporulation protein [Streptomyces sp. NPDC004838]
MVFKRLLGIGDPAEPVEIDTRITPGSGQPGRKLKGEVHVRGGGQQARFNYIRLTVSGTVRTSASAEREREFASTAAWLNDRELAKGSEQRLPFSERMRWEAPVTELGGRALGVVLGVRTTVEVDGKTAESDFDLLHVPALPIHEAILNAFAEEGYLCESAHLSDTYIRRAEQHLGYHQVFVLSDRMSAPSRPPELEVVFLVNAVGAMVYVRRAAPLTYSWDDKPRALRFPAAHHEIGRTDWGPKVRELIGALGPRDDEDD